MDTEMQTNGILHVWRLIYISILIVIPICAIIKTPLFIKNDPRLWEKLRVNVINVIIAMALVELEMQLGIVKFAQQESTYIECLVTGIVYILIVETHYAPWHYAMHHISFLYPIHKLHHSVIEVSPIDSYFMSHMDWLLSFVCIFIPFVWGFSISEKTHLGAMVFVGVTGILEHTPKWNPGHSIHHTKSSEHYTLMSGVWFNMIGEKIENRMPMLGKILKKI